MKQMQLVVLIAGKATRLTPLSYSLPKGLLTINGKPAIFNMISSYIKRGLNDIIFVVSPNNYDIVKSFISKSYSNINVNYVVQDNPKGPLHAFMMCKDLITKPTLLLLGDTQCETNLDYSYDWLGYKTIDDNSHSRWCLIKTNAEENVLDLIDKPDYTPETDKVLIGLYNFKNPQLLKDCLAKEYAPIRNELQLSSLIKEYNKSSQMKGLEIKSWCDTGTLKDYNQAMTQNFACRSFNSLTLNEFGVLTKTSSYNKLKSEIAWLEEVQKSDLSFLIPELYSYEISGDICSYKMEYINGKSLAEYFNFYDIGESNWVYIFEKLLKSIKFMWNKKPTNQKDIVPLARFMYHTKTLERINAWDRQDILNEEFIFANGQKLMGFKKVFEPLSERIENLIQTSKNFYSLIHGDPCFSNIIYFPENSTFKFIDPRGNFGENTIYGDYRYDLAKFRHNYHGLYDLITLDMFTLIERATNNFEYSFFSNNMTNPEVFDNILKNEGFNLDDIELIEGLLFISMIPLHSDNPDAQIMYYITGLKCLNNQLKKL